MKDFPLLPLTAAKFQNAFSHRTARILQCIGVFILLVDITIYAINNESAFLAMFFFFFAFVATLFLWSRFVDYYRSAHPTFLPSPELDPDMLVESLDFETLQIFARKESWNPHDILISLFESPAKAFFIDRLELDEKKLRAVLQTPLTLAHDTKEAILVSAAALAKENHHNKIELSDILLSAVSLSQPFKQFLLQEGFQPKDIEYAALWYKNTLQHEKPSLLTKIENSYGIGKSWAFAFTPILNRFSEPIAFQGTDGEDLHVLIHSHEIGIVEEALAKSAAANALIVGEPGLGAMTIIKGLAEQTARGQSFGIINYKRIMQLKLELVFGQDNFGDVVGTITRIFHEAERAGNIIIVIDDIENYLSTHSKMNISEILMPFLKSTTVKIIGITNRTG
ncbi:MAG: AAA family ATPase, partial [Patescibacteria group bacterium]